MIRNVCLSAVALCLSLLIGGAGAHPHVFVDVGLQFEHDGAGQLTAVEVTWRYDDFFSLLILSDMGLDEDGDGVLTEAERAELKGFDLEEWPEGFEGDLYIHSDGEKITLDHPVPTGVTLEDGRIVATHRRSFDPVPADGLQVEPYDPTYYVEYTVAGPVDLPEECDHSVREPDLDDSQREFRDMISDLPAEEQLDGIEVGNLFSDVMVISCDANF